MSSDWKDDQGNRELLDGEWAAVGLLGLRLINGKGKSNGNALFKEMTACSFSSILV